MSSLYKRMGGEAALMAAVEGFYRRVLADDLTKPFFDGVDMAAQTRKLIGFMTWAFGGPAEYRGRDLREAHAQLITDQGLNDSHFDAVNEHLKATLEDLGVSSDMIDEAVGLVEAQRDEVMGR